ncbi:MAG: hypothetical protein ACE5JI_05705 [Acidobacteriota bacterium]
MGVYETAVFLQIRTKEGEDPAEVVEAVLERLVKRDDRVRKAFGTGRIHENPQRRDLDKGAHNPKRGQNE